MKVVDYLIKTLEYGASIHQQNEWLQFELGRTNYLMGNLDGAIARYETANRIKQNTILRLVVKK